MIDMDTKENLHQGHRQRLLDKLDDGREVLSEHELLETLLYLSIPRKDVNPLAHRLIKAFGGLSGVFEASKNELLAIDGVGKKTAEVILLVGGLYQLAGKEKLEQPVFNTTEKIRNGLRCEFSFENDEVCLLVLLDKNYKQIARLSYSGLKNVEVSINLNEIANALVSFKPCYAVLAHNHVKGVCYPSADDDKTTQRVHMLCSIHGVSLIEHGIFMGENEYFSYHDEGRLDDIKEQSSVKEMLELGGDKNE